MSETSGGDENLKAALSGADGRAAPGPDCPGDEEIWAASRGELPPGRSTEILDHAAGCPSCRESLRAAAVIAEESGLSSGSAAGAARGEVRAFPLPRRRALLAVTALAASLLLVMILPSLLRRDSPGEGTPGPGGALTATLWRVGPGRDEPMESGETLHPGDRLYLTVDTAAPAHVYVINRDARGEVNVLFPVEGAQWSNPVPAGARRRLPGETSWDHDSWQVTSAGERESFVVLASARPLEEIEAALDLVHQASPAPPGERLRGETPPGADPTGGRKALNEALQALASAPRDAGDLYFREIVLENPR